MYEIVMYGVIIVGILAMLIYGIGVLKTPPDKIILKPGQTRETMVKKMRSQGKLCVFGSLFVLIMIVVVVILNGSYLY